MPLKMFYDEFQRKYPKSNIKIGTLMLIDELVPYGKMSEFDSHLLFMHKIGIININEYLDLRSHIKEIRR